MEMATGRKGHGRNEKGKKQLIQKGGSRIKGVPGRQPGTRLLVLQMVAGGGKRRQEKEVCYPAKLVFKG